MMKRFMYTIFRYLQSSCFTIMPFHIQAVFSAAVGRLMSIADFNATPQSALKVESSVNVPIMLSLGLQS